MFPSSSKGFREISGDIRGVLGILMLEASWGHKEVSEVLQERLKESHVVSKGFQMVSGALQGRFDGLRRIQGSFRRFQEVSRVFKEVKRTSGCFKGYQGASRTFLSYREVLEYTRRRRS